MQLRLFRSLFAFESKDTIYLETEWQTTVGLSFGQSPVFAIPKERSNELDSAIRSCLDGVRKGVPHPTDWKKVVRPLYSIAPFKSDRALMAVSKAASIVDVGGQVEMGPYRNEGTREGFRSDGKTKIICSLEDDLGARLLEALDQATYANGKTTM